MYTKIKLNGTKKRDSYEEKYGHLIPSIVIQHIPVCEIFELLNEVKKIQRVL